MLNIRAQKSERAQNFSPQTSRNLESEKNGNWTSSTPYILICIRTLFAKVTLIELEQYQFLSNPNIWKSNLFGSDRLDRAIRSTRKISAVPLRWVFGWCLDLLPFFIWECTTSFLEVHNQKVHAFWCHTCHRFERNKRFLKLGHTWYDTR